MNIDFAQLKKYQDEAFDKAFRDGMLKDLSASLNCELWEADLILSQYTFTVRDYGGYQS